MAAPAAMTPPMRPLRLEAIHDELSRPETLLPISEVALKWGFTHMGRFAASYRSAFGQYPSDTVRRARGFCGWKRFGCARQFLKLSTTRREVFVLCLDHLLPRPSKLARGHHAAMPYEEVATFIADLRQREAKAALALEFCILTAARSGEVLGMQWSEINFDTKTWTVPADRMKAGREHRVPLSSRAIAILRQIEKLKTGEFVLPGLVRNKPMSNMAMEMVLRRMKVEDATVHGFRSSFRDWAGNVTGFAREVVETALARPIRESAFF
ncbi:tyrosine-type recombinase/integrase [Bradyrhizobium sp. 2S1]|uniref:tyrosine-type recombinase/integrase n=1 Tax=Bradyrhizobium sp. 2S1 TaxID=1404429 RepID=UPI00289F6119|nr:tyrosine-type recombinase/integrase [Bradyrhizobium sp. 2S1]